MDDETLRGILTALEQSPANLPLRLLAVHAYYDRGQLDAAAKLLDAATPEALSSDEERLLAARVLLPSAPARARDFAPTDLPEGKLLRARALACLGDLASARLEYGEAVARAPALADATLARALGAPAPPPPGSRHLRVVPRSPEDDQPPTASEDAPITFADVGGLTEAKALIEQRIVLPFTRPSLFKRFKRRPGGGLLLYGPPGCGKTMLARATAGEVRAHFTSVASVDVLDLYVGGAERKLRELFEEAGKHERAVLFFDELEALAGRRQYARDGTSAQLVSAFLSEMDGFVRRAPGVLVLGATNVPWAIDPAFRRPGRFERVLFVPPPDHSARLAILSRLLEERPHEQLDVDALAKRSAGYSGADLTHLVDSACDAAIGRALGGEETPLHPGDFEQAFKGLRPTCVEWLTTARNYARYANDGGLYDEVVEFLRRHGEP